MPKLLIVTTVAATLRAFLLPYARHFRQAGWRVDALSGNVLDCPECLEAFDQCHDISFSRKPWDVKNFKGVGARIRALVAENGYDIVHVHTPVAAFVTRFALRGLPKETRPKIVYTAHGFHFHDGGGGLKNALFAALERLAGDWTDHLIVINGEDQKAAATYKILTPDRVSLLPGIGLDIARYRSFPLNLAGIEKVCAELRLRKNDELFVMPAEFNRGKRHKDALNALAKTGKKNFHLAFAGIGPLLQPMKHLAAKLGLDQQTHFLGQRDDLPLLMLAARAIVLPSEREGLNRSVMESICLGIPILGADARGIRDLVTDASRGALFPVGNTAALAAAMILAVEEPCPVRPSPDPLWDLSSLLPAHEQIYRKLLSA